MNEICVMENGRFEIYQGQQADRLLESGKVYLCQCDDECAPNYFAHFGLDFIDEFGDDDGAWEAINKIATS